MIFLTVDAAIFHEVAATILEFNVVHFRFAARGTYLLNCLLLYAAHCVMKANISSTL